MGISKEQSEALDRAQLEINRVLELTGNVFTAAKNGNRHNAQAAVSRLKLVLNPSVNNFQDALDVLDEQLHHAKMVMRRDLAVCREKIGQKPVVSAEPSISDRPSPSTKVDEPDVPEDTRPVQQDHVEDVDMLPSDTSAKNGDPTNTSDAPEVANTVSQTKDDASLPESKAAEQQEDDKAKDNAPNPELTIDTTLKQSIPEDPESAADQEQPPNTAFSNNADLDSLFNDPASAGGMAGDSTSMTGGQDFGTDANDASNEFDFESFSAGLDGNDGGDSISALLPDLQDYTTDQVNGNDEPDFSALFALNTGIPDASQSQEQGGDQQDGEEPRDMTFDDLMDFNFDVGDGNGDGGQSHNDALDFDFN